MEEHAVGLSKIVELCTVHSQILWAGYFHEEIYVQGRC